MIWSQTARLAALDYVLWDYGAPKKFRDAVRTKLTADLEKKSRDKIDMTYLYGKMTYGEQSGDNFNLDYSPRYLGHEIASGRSESNVWSVANTD